MGCWWVWGKGRPVVSGRARTRVDLEVEAVEDEVAGPRRVGERNLSGAQGKFGHWACACVQACEWQGTQVCVHVEVNVCMCACVHVRVCVCRGLSQVLCGHCSCTAADQPAGLTPATEVPTTERAPHASASARDCITTDS
jgi:hypothetical protein